MTATTPNAPGRPTPAPPALRVLSLGAGVQSSTLLLLAIHGHIPSFDHALFADTGWEPPAVYRHLRRLEALAADAGIGIRRVSGGNIRDDALDADHRFASMPLFGKGPNGERQMARRQCTNEYKLRPLKKEVRRLLGYPHPARVPAGVYAEQAIGISVDEVHRAKDADVRYLKNRFPLIDLGWDRERCRTYLASRGLADTPRSACVGCPLHSNRTWAQMKRRDPDAFADAVAFDEAIRHGHPAATAGGHPLRGTYYLHSSRIPLRDVDLTQVDTGEPDGCSPWACRGDTAAEATHTAADGADADRGRQ